MGKSSNAERGTLPLFSDIAASKCRPFLKWAGGKTQLLPQLTKRLPEKINNYFEPFVGGGALFFEHQFKKATLSDVNADLVEAYLVVKNHVEELIIQLKEFPKPSKSRFYHIRSWDRDDDFQKLSPVKRTARLIYLNKTCYNGLYRVNAKGQFNVPFGDYTNPQYQDEKNLRACSTALRGTKILNLSYVKSVKRAKKGDFVYFDPPYAPLSATSNFTSYSASGFAVSDQEELAALCQKLHKKGVLFMLSNSSADLVKRLYRDFQIDYVDASRAINSKASGRGKIREVIVTNY